MKTGNENQPQENIPDSGKTGREAAMDATQAAKVSASPLTFARKPVRFRKIYRLSDM